jgi:hypothetical protein
LAVNRTISPPPDVLLRSVAIFDESFEPPLIGRRNGDGFSCPHRAESHAPQQEGIQKGTQPSDLIH